MLLQLKITLKKFRWKIFFLESLIFLISLKLSCKLRLFSQIFVFGLPFFCFWLNKLIKNQSSRSGKVKIIKVDNGLYKEINIMIPIKIKISEIKLINPLKKSTPNFTSLISRIKADELFWMWKEYFFFK